MKLDRTPVIVAAKRTPIGKRNGVLSGIHPHQLLAHAQNAVLGATGLNGQDLDLVITGCVTKVGEQGYNIARMAALASGLPSEVPGITLDAQCGSSQQGVNIAAAMIKTGASEVILASGVESMSRVPLGSDRELGPGDAFSPGYRDRYELLSVGESAERIADKWAISRSDCDAWAARSQQLAAAAAERGDFAAELEPVATEEATVSRDEGIRESTIEKLASLKPSFRPDGTLTAASSSQISDGAAAVLVMARGRARSLGLPILAVVDAQVIVGVDPILRLTGPIPVTQQILDLTGRKIDDIGFFEVNEAFASVVLAWLRDSGAPPDRTNVNGGAIALGHPVGATGARLITSAVHELARRGAESALVAMCCGGGLGTGTLLLHG